MKTLRTAVVGLGRIGWKFHVQQVVRHKGFELIGVVDPLGERLEEAKSAFEVQGYRDFDGLLAAEKPDLVVVASPTPFHCEQAVAAFKHGCDVFCDKPMAPSLEEADRMIEAMEASGRKLMGYQPRRGDVEVVALREILRRDVLGPVYMMKLTRSQYRRRNDWQAFRKYGGGMLNNYGAHVIDQALYLAGSRAKTIACKLRTVASLGDADDVVKAVIETENGVVLDVDINMATAHSTPPWLILGAHGSALFDAEQKAWQVRYFRPEDLPELTAQEGLAARDRLYDSGAPIPWQEEVVTVSDFQEVDFYQNCYDYFALDKAPFVPVAETREVMRVLEACRQEEAG